MARLNILTNQEFLRQKSKPVTEFGERLNILLDDMIETSNDGHVAGLAAPQVGILWRVAIVKAENGLIELINPEIIQAKGSKVGEEACLSIPGEYGFVSRPAKIKIRNHNRKGEQEILFLRGFDAVVACHEIDHLDGILYTDRAVEKTPDPAGHPPTTSSTTAITHDRLYCPQNKTTLYKRGIK